MKFIISFLFFSFLFIISSSFYINKNEEIDNRIFTENSATKIKGDLYMINYTNDYYFEDLLEKGSKNITDLIK